jgi:ABC-type glycerol-3-phosphate transport system substrate-binding protein
MRSIKWIVGAFAILLGLSITTSVFAATGSNSGAGATVTTTVEPTEESKQVPQAIADYFEVEVSAVVAWHTQGYGYGEIVKAYALAKETGKTVEEIFAMFDAGKGWGEIIKDLGLQPGKLEPNLGDVMKDSKPDKDKSDAAPGKSGEHKPDDKEKNNGKGTNK